MPRWTHHRHAQLARRSRACGPCESLSITTISSSSGTRSISALFTRLMTRPIVSSSFSAGSPRLIVTPCCSLSSTSLRDVAELGGVEGVLGEPAVDDGGQRASVLDERVRRGQRPLGRAQLVEERDRQLLLGLDHDHRRLGAEATASATTPNRKRPSGRHGRRIGRCAHHHQLVVARLAEDRRPDRCGLAQDADHLAPGRGGPPRIGRAPPARAPAAARRSPSGRRASPPPGPRSACPGRGRAASPARRAGRRGPGRGSS